MDASVKSILEWLALAHGRHGGDDAEELHQQLLVLRAATIPPGRFGAINMDGDKVATFIEKPKGDGGMINGGFFVLSPDVMDYIAGDATIWEREPLEKLAAEGNLAAYQHRGFWQPMDTLRDKQHLEQLWQEGAPWKIW